MAIVVKGLKKQFNGYPVFDGLSFKAEKGRITAIFGPNGCGKSTLFNILSGSVVKDGGEAVVAGFDRFRFSYVFQNYRESLLPWRTNWENLAFPLEIQGMSKGEIKKRISCLMSSLEINLGLDKYPYELSGGQQQILVFLRALLTQPSVLLLDEPFSALDYENHLRMCSVLQKYYLEHKPTILMITHHIEEAVHLAGDIFILSRCPARVLGRIENALPYPRTVESLKSEEFHQIKNSVLRLFQEEVRI